MSASEKWSITWGGKTWTEDDVTGAHAALVVLTMGNSDGWDVVDPTSGPIALMAWISACVSIDSGRDLTEVHAEVAAASWPAIVAALTVG